MFLLLFSAASASPYRYAPPIFPTEVSVADPVTRPEIRVDIGEPLLTALPLLYSDIIVEAYAGLARVTLLQDFVAPPAGGEAAYLLPLPDHAVVDRAEMQCGGHSTEGVIVPRSSPLVDGRAAQRFALLDAQDSETFSWQLGALCDDTVTLMVQYTVALSYDNERYTMSMPWSASEPGPLPWMQQPVLPEQNVTVFTDAGMLLDTVESPIGRLNVRHCGGKPVTRLKQQGAGDVRLSWSLSGVSVTHHRPDPEQPGTIALVIPPEVLGELPSPPPRELLFVIDSSCSMQGVPSAQAQAAVEHVLAEMLPNDTFNLYRLYDEEPLFSSAQPISAVARAAAEGWLASQGRSSGGNPVGLAAALQEASAQPVTMLALLTDGHLDTEALCSELTNLIGGSRIYPVGLGGYANRALLNRLAAQSRGMALYPDTQTAPRALGRQLADALAPPMLSGVSIEWGDLQIIDQQPARPLDISTHQPLRVFARYTSDSSEPVTIRVHGRLGTVPVVLEVPVTLQTIEPHHEGLTTTWASQRITAMALDNQKPKHTRAAITLMALNHNLVTRYTALVSMDDQSTLAENHLLPPSVSPALAALEWAPVTFSIPPRAPRPVAKPAWTPPKTDLSTVGMNLPTGEAADQIRALVDARQQDVRRCYTQRLRDRPDLEGTVAVDVVIEDGKVASLQLSENTTTDRRLARCVAQQLRDWSYPDTLSGHLHLPFTLSIARR